MIVKFLRKSASFGGVRYNTKKVDSDQGELISTRNFDALQGLQELRPQDYINYLEAVSAMSSHIKYPQLHVVISAKGNEYGKHELSAVAHDWMQGMGYGEQPYLVILHRDTANAHVHIVSTRVGKDGKKINNSFEKIRAYEVLHEILGEKAKHNAQRDLATALTYNFSTRAQFRTLLEDLGYHLSKEEQLIKLSKFGKMLGELRWEDIDKQILQYREDSARTQQVKALLDKYGHQFDREIKEEKGIFSSALTRELKLRFGLTFVFHAADGKPPYGYTLIDHSRKNVYKGSQILALARLTGGEWQNEPAGRESSAGSDRLSSTTGERWLPRSPESNIAKILTRAADQPMEEVAEEPSVGLYLADDVDDEAVHGIKRRRGSGTSTKKR